MRATEVGEVIVETVVEIGGVISVAPVSDGARRKVAILIPYEKLEVWFEALTKKLLQRQESDMAMYSLVPGAVKDINWALHVARNPWGWSEDDQREARLMVCDKLETFMKAVVCHDR